ncbi:MAG: amidohydrolase, partial [Comamonas sp.]
DWLRSDGALPPLSKGAAADFVLLPHSNATAFPSRNHQRIVIRQGQCTYGQAPAQWLSTISNAIPA